MKFLTLQLCTHAHAHTHTYTVTFPSLTLINQQNPTHNALGSGSLGDQSHYVALPVPENDVISDIG